MNTTETATIKMEELETPSISKMPPRSRHFSLDGERFRSGELSLPVGHEGPLTLAASASTGKGYTARMVRHEDERRVRVTGDEADTVTLGIRAGANRWRVRVTGVVEI